MAQPFLKRIISKPPMLFPWVALLHAALFLYLFIDYAISMPFPDVMWIQPAWMLAYTLVWLAACDMKRWSVYAYIGLTAISIILQVALREQHPTALNTWGDMLFPGNVLFCFLLLFYYKKFS